MPVPDFQSIMLPLLSFLKDGEEKSIREAIDHIGTFFKLTEEEKIEPLPRGNQPKLDNRVGWSRTYMKKAGLLESPGRGYIKITDKGKKLLKNPPERINISFLMQFPEFAEFRAISRGEENEQSEIEQGEAIQTPDELMDRGYNLIRGSLAQEILNLLRSSSPAFFEKIVLELLSTMDYGEGQVTGRSGDEGIDGFVDQDKLGLDKIFFQAKRFKEGNNITASMIRDFVGALELHGASKGVFIATSNFPRDSEEIIQRSRKSIVLINGVKLVNYMIDYNLGVTTEKTYDVKRIDTDYFAEE